MAQSDGHDAPGLIDELVPRHTAVVDEIVVRFEDAVRQPQGDLLWADLNCSEVEVLQAPLYARGTSDMRINKQRAHPAMASGGKDDCSNKMVVKHMPVRFLMI